ncbi:MAG: glycoside hydrolase family 3 protein [Solobacterium sp.]|nr:glycoside hydrolase family 3 protein [Solobacterium sp.]
MRRFAKEILAAAVLTAGLAGCASPAASSSEPVDPVQEKLSQMTLQEKVEQMIILSIRNWNEAPFTVLDETVGEYLKAHLFGGFIAFRENITGNDQIADLLEDMQETVTGAGGIPLVTAIDQEGGTVWRMSHGVSGPGNMPLGATGDPENAREMAALTARELRAAGFNTDFAPVLDVNSNPSNPIIGVRSFSDDVNTVIDFGRAFLAGLQSERIIGSLKHFPGHGDTDVDSHTGLPKLDLTYEELMTRELIPFAACIEAGAEMIMTAHIQYPAIETASYTSILDGTEVFLPATLSHEILTGILREKMGFQGVICTDSMLMDSVAKHFDPKDSARLTILAGADIILMPVLIESPEDLDVMTKYIDDIIAMVNDGTIPESRIDESVMRILNMKQKAGILRRTYDADLRRSLHEGTIGIGSAEHLEQERRIGDKAVTVLENNDILPIPAGAYTNILMVGMRNDHPAALNYGIKRLREEGLIPEGVNTESISLNYGDGKEACIAALEGKDLLIITTNMYSVSQLDLAASESMGGTERVISAAKEAEIPVVLISSGQPYDSVLFPDADAVLCVYDPVGMTNVAEDGSPAGAYGTMIPCALDVIFGHAPALGKLPLSLPEVEDGVFTGEIRYPRGSGITDLSSD